MRILNRTSIAILLVAVLCHAIASAQHSFTPQQYAADFDLMWSGLRDKYAYFDKKQTDWSRVRELYRSQLAAVRSRNDFVTLLEHVLAELYDDHASLNTNLETSPRLVPSGADIWAEWTNGRAIITQLRSGFSAEQAGLKPGMEVVSINGLPITEAVALRLPKCLKTPDIAANNWALRAVLAGTHDRPRVVQAKHQNGLVVSYQLDLSTQTTVDNYRYTPRVESRMLPHEIFYIKINDLIATEIVSQFDSALNGVRNNRGLILDLRDIPRGGSTDVAEPILGRFISRTMGYQQVVPLHAPAYIKEVSPRGEWQYQAPVVVLVDRWTASMAEGMAIGFDGMKRATIVGTQMAGLNGGIFNLELPHTRISVNYPGERLNHINGTPRENFVPPVSVNLMDGRWKNLRDPILEVSHKELEALVMHRSAE